MTIETIRIEPIIKVHFAPTLRAQGFTGSGRTFRRAQNGQIHVVNIQGSSYGGQFAINLAIQPLAIPNVLGNEPDAKKIVESACELRRRLSESGADQWWRYDDSASVEKAMDDAVKVYEEYGRPAFEAMSMSPSPLDTINLEQLVEGSVGFNGFETSKVRSALMIARLREAEGRICDAVSFAAYGLEHSTRAFGLRSELERIAALPMNPLIQTL